MTIDWNAPLEAKNPPYLVLKHFFPNDLELYEEAKVTVKFADELAKHGLVIVDRNRIAKNAPQYPVELVERMVGLARMASGEYPEMHLVVDEARAIIAKIEPPIDGELEEALAQFIYETTHLSPLNDDGSHDCRISAECLEKARAAIKRIRTQTQDVSDVKGS